MPDPRPIPQGAPIWIDLFSSDTDGAVAFYGDLFAWTGESAGADFGGYINLAKDGRRVAGCMHNDGTSGAPDGWTVYLSTDDANRTIAAASACGSAVVVPAMAVADLGTMGVVADAGGAMVGLWQPGVHDGFEVADEAGSPNWFELHTRDYDATIAFYRDVFAWDVHTVSDSDEFRYSTYGEGEGQRAGIMDASAFLPDRVPAHWSIYFAVTDVDASIARAIELGGALVMAAEDTPYGRLATLSDRTGAMFKLRGLG